MNEHEGFINGEHFKYPHCNTEVLHAPGECRFCDFYPDRQAARASVGGFTPPEANGWYGNVAQPVQNVFEDCTSVSELLGCLAGAASRCWVGGTGNLEFDPTLASKFVNDAEKQLERIQNG